MLIPHIKLDHMLYLINYGSIFLQDLLDNGVEIELMHIGSRFDVSKFYQVLYVYSECLLYNHPHTCTCIIYYDILQFEAIMFYNHTI